MSPSLIILMVSFILIILTVLTFNLYIASFFKLDLLYEYDKSKPIEVTKNLIYKETKEKSLPMDIYRPGNIGNDEKLPAVIFIHGEGLERMVGNAKEWNFYQSYGRLAASSGFVGITFNRSRMNLNFKNTNVKQDILDAVAYVRENADKLNIDKNRICIWTFSMGGLYLSLFLKDTPDYIKCLISYYGLLDIKAKTKASNDQYENYRPENYLPQGPDNVPPLLIVKAAKDKIKGLNQSIDNFMKTAQGRNIPFDYILHSTGGHSFDALVNNQETKAVIRQTLEFIESKIE